MTPRSGVELLRGPQRGPTLLPLGSPTSHWEDWSFVSKYFFHHKLATLPLLPSSPWVQAHLVSSACSSLPGTGREILRLIFFFLSYFFPHSTPSLVLTTYMSCWEYVCEWIGQIPSLSCKKILLYCNVHGLTWGERYWQGLGNPQGVFGMTFDLISVDLFCNRPEWGFPFTYCFDKGSVLKVCLEGIYI